MKLPRTRFTLLMWLVSAGSSACYAQGKTACDLFTKADAESVLGVPAERFSAPGMAADRCQFRQVGWQQKVPYNKQIEVYLGSVEANNYATILGRFLRIIAAAPKRDLKELTDLGDAAFWEWDAYEGGSGALRAYKAGTISSVLVVGIPEDSAFAHSKRIVLKLLGSAAKTGYVYPGSPAQKGFSMSILPISADALDASGKIAAESQRQVAALREKGQRVVHCVYNPFTRPTAYYYWYMSPPDNMGQLLASPSNPLAVLGGSGVQACPETLELAQKRTQTLQGPCSRLHFGDREWTNDEVLTLLKEHCEVILSPRGQSFIAGLSDYLGSTCHLPADRTARAEITTFLSAAFLVASEGSQRSNPRVLTAVRDQLSNAFAYKAGNEYMTEHKLGCDDKRASTMADDVVHYLGNTVYVNGGEPRFVPGCVAHYGGRYTQGQCQCVADLARSVIPNIHQAEFSPTIIGSIPLKNIAVATLVAARCGIVKY